MFNLIWLSLSVLLIFVILIRTPRNNGISSLTTKTDLLGSPSSVERFLNNLTTILILIYFIIALCLNFKNLN